MHIVGLWKETGEKQDASCSEPALMQASMASCFILLWVRRNIAVFFVCFFLNMRAQEVALVVIRKACLNTLSG